MFYDAQKVSPICAGCWFGLSQTNENAHSRAEICTFQANCPIIIKTFICLSLISHVQEWDVYCVLKMRYRFDTWPTQSIER